MKGDLISCNGTLSRWDDSVVDMEYLISTNFVYQKIHTLSHRTLQVDAHIEISETSYRTLYGSEIGLTSQKLSTDIELLLEANRIPRGSNLVVMYIIPPKKVDGLPMILLSCERQMLYKGYTLWHSSLRSIVTPYEYSFPLFKTATSLAAHNYATNYAQRKGADVAIVQNHSGVLIGVGENPLFGILGREVFTTPIDSGVAESVERRLGIVACAAAGLTLIEEPMCADQIRQFDELFTITPQGVTGIGHCLGKYFPNSMAKNIASLLSLHNL